MATPTNLPFDPEQYIDYPQMVAILDHISEDLMTKHGNIRSLARRRELREASRYIDLAIVAIERGEGPTK